MSDELRFDGRVAIVTGAGNGLGRSHALLLASRGAKVVVNDLGGAATGGGQSSAAADKVVAEIKAAGGEAVANHDSVEDGSKIVQCALDSFKRLDVVINNAGILRDASFHKMTADDWDVINRVHVQGAFKVTHAAWPHLRDQGYGRIIFTASAAGLYGNFGQANYAAAKLGLVGLASTLALEGAKKNVRTNVIAPLAGSRLTETVMPKEMADQLKPEYVSPLVAWLCHEACDENGGLFEVGGGFFARLRWERTAGKRFKLGRAMTPEQVRGAWAQITDFTDSSHPGSVSEALAPAIENLGTTSKGGNEFIDVDQALGYQMEDAFTAYTERDLSLYALGVGAAQNALDPSELKLVYELGEGIVGLPTWAVVQPINAILKLASEGKAAPGLNYGLDRILHGEQYTEVLRPLPPRARLRHVAKIKDIFDKGKNALVITAIDTFDQDTGEALFKNEVTMFVRGAGGWGGDRGPSADINVPPARPADQVISEKTSPNQALLYRLSGDWNPLHVDPEFARMFGFDKPILHGLCTFGYVGRHVIKAFAGNDHRLFKSIKVRFAETVYPGETLKTEMWKVADGRIVVRCSAVDRDKVVISNAAVELFDQVPTAKALPAAATPAAPASDGITAVDVFAAIAGWVEQNPDVVGRVANVFHIKLSSPDSAWTVDLKNGRGSVAEGAHGKADCTLELTDSDWMDTVQGKADPQKLYFAKKLKISGNVMASQKLEFLKKLDRSTLKAGGGRSAARAAAPGSSAQASTGPAVAPAVFKALGERVARTPGLVAEVNAVLQFNIRSPDASWLLNLKEGTGSVAQGRDSNATATLTLTDEALGELAKGAALEALYMAGKVRVDGDVRAAHHLGFFNQLL